MDRTSGLPLELKATLHARSPTRTRSTSHQLIAGDALCAAPDTLPRSGFVHGRRAVVHRPLSQGQGQNKKTECARISAARRAGTGYATALLAALPAILF